jgi:hypothetical protein
MSTAVGRGMNSRPHEERGPRVVVQQRGERGAVAGGQRRVLQPVADTAHRRQEQRPPSLLVEQQLRVVLRQTPVHHILQRLLLLGSNFLIQLIIIQGTLSGSRRTRQNPSGFSRPPALSLGQQQVGKKSEDDGPGRVCVALQEGGVV